MAPIAKKTYSRRESKTNGQKIIDDCDPFDKLLLSPLKKNFDFKPLSFWEKKPETLKSNCQKAYKIFSEHYDSDCSSSDSSGARPLNKSWKLLKAKTKRKQKTHFKNNLENNLEKKWFNKSKKSNSLLHYNFSKSLEISLDHYLHVTIKRGGEYNFPAARTKFRGPSIKKSSLTPYSHFRVDEVGTSDLYKTYTIDKKIHESHSVQSFEEEGDEDSTLKSIGFNIDVNNNDVDATIINKKGFIDYTSLNAKDSYENNSFNDQNDWNNENKSPLEQNKETKRASRESQNIVSLIKNVSDMVISCESPKKPDNILREQSYNSLISSEEKSESKINNSVMDLSKKCSKLEDSNFRNITKRRYLRNSSKAKNLNSSNEKTLQTFHEVKECEMSELNSTILNVMIPNRFTAENKARGSLNHCNENSLLEFNSSFVAHNPIFESTRIGNNEGDNKAESALIEKSISAEISFTLKPGKQWRRSMSILRKIQNDTFSTSHISSIMAKKGRHYKTFVENLVAMQKEISNCTILEESGDVFETLLLKNSNQSAQSSTLVESQTIGHGDVRKADYFLSSAQNSKPKCIPRRTMKIVETDNSFEKTSILRNVMEYQDNSLTLQDLINGTCRQSGDFVSAKDIILNQCGQTDVLPFEEYFNEKTLKNCHKIGEGVFGEVFMDANDTVYKVIPIEGEEEVNGEPQKKFEEILTEIIIASKLSNLREEESENQTFGFSEMKRCWCVIGKYPEYLLKLWKEYDLMGSGSENDSPDMFKSDQLYIVLELQNGGKSLESFVFNSAEQSLSIFVQTALTLAIAEKELEFEHRDLHWGNLLISRTKQKTISMVFNGIKYELPSKGVKVSIIDFTLSRIMYESCCLFNDLSLDPTLFTSQGDYQFEIYRKMQKELENDWSQYRPRTNIFWLHYILDKMLKMVKYKNRNTQTHKKYIKELKFFESNVLKYENSSDFVLEYIERWKIF